MGDSGGTLAQDIAPLDKEGLLRELLMTPDSDHGDLLASNDHLSTDDLSWVLHQYQQALRAPTAGLTLELAGEALPLRAAPAAMNGRTLGAYQIQSLINVGGMGAVYRGSRIDGSFEQDVAIKVMLEKHLETEGFLEQAFRAERQTLARLSHPHIAAILDGGITDDGVIYFVMELIEGIPLDQYCNTHHCDVDQRLGLFDQVVQAVAYAHSRLVLHCDLKPSNILVTAQGNVKLVDFGIAQSLSSGQESQLTWLSPSYASPEQIRGESLSVASDIYQIGVLLYQLIFNRLPYNLVESGTDKAAWLALREHQLEVPDRAEQGGRVGSDLKSILGKALAFESTDRYATVAELVADLKAWRDNRPIAAYAHRRSYVLTKFIQRNWKVAGLLTVLIASLAGFSWVTYQQSMDLRVQRQVAQQNADDAIRQSDRFQTAFDYMKGLFVQTDPLHYGRPVNTLEDLMAFGVRAVEGELAEQPEVAAQVLITFSLAYLRRDDQAKALALQQQAESIIAEMDVITDELAFSHAMLRAAISSRDGDQQRSQQFLNQAESRLSAVGINDQALWLTNSVISLRNLGQPEQARALIARHEAILQGVDAKQNPGLYADLLNARQLVEIDSSTALAMLQEMLDLRVTHQGTDHFATIQTGLNLAATHMIALNHREAREGFNDWLPRAEQSSDYTALRLTVPQSNYGLLLTKMGAYDEAKPYLTRSVQTIYNEHPERESIRKIVLDLRLMIWHLEQGMVAQSQIAIDDLADRIKQFVGEESDWLIRVNTHKVRQLRLQRELPKAVSGALAILNNPLLLESKVRQSIENQLWLELTASYNTQGDFATACQYASQISDDFKDIALVGGLEAVIEQHICQATDFVAGLSAAQAEISKLSKMLPGDHWLLRRYRVDAVVSR